MVMQKSSDQEGTKEEKKGQKKTMNNLQSKTKTFPPKTSHGSFLH